MSLIEVKVPDIGDFKEIPVIEVLVKAGDTVEKEQSLVTLESDKATMDVPSSEAGVVKEVKVKVGDNVSEGTLIVVLEGSADAAKPAEKAPEAPAAKPAEKAAEKSRPRRPRRLPRRRAAAIRAAPISNATCWCSARAPAAIRPRSAPPTSA